MPTQATTGHIDSFWAGYVGFAPELLRTIGTCVVPFQNPDHKGIHLFRRGNLCLVSTTAERLQEVTDKLSGEPPDRVFDGAYLSQVFATVTRVTGPSLIAVCDATDFQPSDALGSRKLLSADDPPLRRLEGASAAQEWEYSALNQEADEAFGCFVGEKLVAAGRLHDLRGQVLSVGVLTHPDHRGHGYGRAVVSAMTRYGIEAGRVMFYRTLLSNRASVQIARSLGYQEYCRTLFVRLLPSEGEQKDLLRQAGVT